MSTLEHQFDALKKQIEERKELAALESYRPQSFHWEFITSSAQTRLFVGSNQSGKTLVVCQIILAHVLGYYPWIRPYYKWLKRNWNDLKFPYTGWWFKKNAQTPEVVLEYERIQVKHPVKIAVIAIDYESAIVEKILETIPGELKNGKYVKNVEKSQGRIVKRIIFQNGSYITFFSKQQEDMHFEGGTWDLVVFDEPPKQEHYVAMKRGTLVKDAPILFSMTPLNEPWIFDTLFADAKSGSKDIHLSVCDLYSKEIHWMSDKNKDEFKRDIERRDPHEVEARVHGNFTHLMGRIYPTYDESIHLVKSSKLELNAGYTFGMTLDPHDRKPFMVTWWYVDGQAIIHFFKEWPNEPFPEMRSCDLTIEDYIEMFRKVESELPWKISYRFIDPNSGPKRNVLTGQSLIDEFAKHGMYFDSEINDDLKYGHTTVREYLDYDPDKDIGFKNTPHLFVYDSCYNLNAGMSRYTWNEKKSKETVSEKPHEKWKDPCDVIRYTCVKHPVWIEPGVDKIFTPSTFGRIHV